MSKDRGQINVVYMSYFVLLGLVFLGFVFAFSNSFKQDSSEEITKYITESIFARIEKTALELRAIQNQTAVEAVVKTINIPSRIGGNIYQVVGSGNKLIFISSGNPAVYKTKQIYWQGVQFEGSADSQNSEINLLYNSTSYKIRIS